MKKTLLIGLVLLLTSGMAIAQQNGGPEGPRAVMEIWLTTTAATPAIRSIA